MRPIIVVGAALLMLLLPLPVSAQSFPAESSSIYSPDPSYLTFEGVPDENGLIVYFGIPKAQIRDWPVAVYNDSGETLQNLTLAISEIVDGQPQLYNDAVHFSPLEIKPGEWGFAGFTYRVEGNSFPFLPANGEDAQFSYKVTSPNPGFEPAINLSVTSASLDSGGDLDGSISNPSESTVKDIFVQYLCVENSGLPLEFEERALSQKRLKPGMTADFGFEAGTCNGSYFVSAYALPA